jgi:signal transduction histidine kinase
VNTSADRILLVESDDHQTDLLREMFAAEGMLEVAQARDLTECLSWLSHHQIDLIVLDLALLGVSGLEALRRVREVAPAAPIVVLTESDDDGLGARAVSQGAQDYLRKGQLTPDSLTRSARHALARSRTETHLRLFQRLEAVAHLAGGVAHDFNNLLLVILGSAELMASEGQLNETQRGLVGEIMRAGRRGADLTRKLLAFSRQQVMSRRAIRLDETLDNLQSLLGHSLGEDILLEVHSAARLPPVMADAGQIEQVIMNLALNARDAMPQGGTLRIETDLVRLEPEDPWLTEHPPQTPGVWVRLRVADTGPGIPPSILERVFEPFFTTKEDGTGLGLSTVYGIVKQSDGYVWVDSTPAGTTFEIYLPATEGDQPAHELHDPPAPAERRPRRILLVEDDQHVRHLTATILSQEGHEVTTATDGLEALRMLADREVDLVITDVIMPRLSGPALVRRLRETGRQIPALYVSGYTTQQMARHGLLDPAENLLLKPFTRAELLRKIDQVLQ